MKGAVARLIEIDVVCDGVKITRYRADGVIIATPTGSTAYSMSAGGPIIEPAAKNIIITPICAHALMAHSFVLTQDRTVTVTITLTGGKRGYLAVDGGAFDLEDRDRIEVTKSHHVTRLVKVSTQTFYQALSEKLTT